MSQRILVVDDNVDTREMLHMYLTAEGYDVVMASTGGEGLYLIGAQRPDIIITDISLGDIDGTDLIRTVRESPETSSLPIIAITALADVRKDDIKLAGADRLVAKPMDPDQLLSEVRSLLGDDSD
jgi:DNA-binding response OmpR family regulator